MEDPLLIDLYNKIKLEIGKTRSEFTSKYINFYIDKLYLIDIKNFIIYMYSKGNGCNSCLWFSFKIWKSLSYKDWVDISVKLCKQKGDVYSFLPLIYNYLEIDLITPLLNINIIDNDSKEYIQKMFFLPNSDTLGLKHLEISNIEDYFAKYDINMDNLRQLKYRLISEGASEADKDKKQIV